MRLTRRVLRSMLALLAAASLLACVAAVTMWAGSYAVPTPPAPSTARMQVALARRMPEVQFDSVGFSDVMDFLRDVSGANIFVDWKALEAAGIDRNTPVSLRAKNVRFGEAAARVTAAVNGLALAADGDLLVISTPDGLRHPRVSERPGRGTELARAALGRPIRGRRIDEMSMVGASLEEALRAISTASGVPISPDWPALQAAGITPERRVIVRLHQVSAALALAYVLRDARPKQDVQFQLQGTTVVVSTRQRFDADAPGRRWLVVAVCAASALVAAPLAILIRRRTRRTRLAARPESRRAWRIAFLTAVALLICAAAGAVAVWARPSPVREGVWGSRRLTLAAHHGTLRLWSTPADPASVYQNGTPVGDATGPEVEDLFGAAGVTVRRGGSPFNAWVVAAPFWGLAAATALVPLAWLAATARRLRRPGPGRCRVCGYDLRATPSEGGPLIPRCPECGTPAAAPPTAPAEAR